MTLYGTLSLGELVELLSRRDPEQCVTFDFCGFGPTTLDSYRGYYEHLAIDYEPNKRPQVADVIATLLAAVGETYTGWKGGDYTMGLDTPLWVATRGESHGTAIVGIVECDYQTVLETRFVP